MLSLYTTIPPKYIEKSRLKDYFFKGYDTKTGKDLPIKITIADIIDNAKTLFGKDYDTKVLVIWTWCDNNKPIEEISEYVIKNIK